MRKQGNGALMFGFAGVRMKPFVQRRRSGHGVQQQDQTGQQRGDGRLAGWFAMARHESHNNGKLAYIMPDARGFLQGSAGPRPGSMVREKGQSNGTLTLMDTEREPGGILFAGRVPNRLRQKNLETEK